MDFFPGPVMLIWDQKEFFFTIFFTRLLGTMSSSQKFIDFDSITNWWGDLFDNNFCSIIIQEKISNRFLIDRKK